MTYLHNAIQYIVIAVSTREHPAELVALALPKGNRTAQTVDRRQSRADASSEARSAVNVATSMDLRAGKDIYAKSCAECHGRRGEGIKGSASPLSGLSDVAFIMRVVSDGSVKMPAMRTLLTKEQIEQVSRFVAVELNRK
jgi:quinoprotein glucose dehydrogenase